MRKLKAPLILAALIPCSQLVSCSQPAGVANDVGNEAASATADAAPDEVRFYGRESFTIVSAQTGVESGTVTEHVRDWGRRRVEIKNAQYVPHVVTVDAGQKLVFVNRDDFYQTVLGSPRRVNPEFNLGLHKAGDEDTRTFEYSEMGF